MIFSVVIPLYNKKPYILRAIESVLAQSHPPTEVIVVDDGSTDGGGELVKKAFPHVRVIAKQNAGVGAARNTGIEAASADWIALLDADDIWLPSHLQELARVIREVPEAHLISTQFQQIRYGDAENVQHPSPGKIERIDYFLEASKRIAVVWTSCAAFRRSVFDECGGFGTMITGEDSEFWARVALKYPVAVSWAQTAFYVRGVGGVMETLAAKKLRDPGRQDVLPENAACRTVKAALSGQDLVVSRRSLQLYLNLWNIIRIRGALVQGNSLQARISRRELSGPMRPAWYGILLLALLPEITTFILRLRRRVFDSR